MKTDIGFDDTESDVQAVGSTYFAEHIEDAKFTPNQDIDELLQSLDSHEREWAQLEIGERLLLLEEVRNDLFAIKDLWIQSEVEAKGVPPQTFGVAEEWTMLAQVFRAIRQIQTTLMNIDRLQDLASFDSVSSGPEDRVVLRVFPQTIWDRAIFLNVTGDVWFQAGINVKDALTRKAAKYGDPDYQGKVALVLGGGNSSMLPVCDTFHKLFVDLQVVMLKLNPVNAHLGPLIEKGLKCFIERGFVAVAYGGAKVGAYICNHPLVDELHMTGSDKTYEAVVFGGGSEGRRRKQEREPLNTKPFTAELGNVTPVIVVPGPWKGNDVDEYAKYIATWLVANAGFACLTPRAIIQHESWPQRMDLTKAIRGELAKYPTRRAYYPGAFKIHSDFHAAHPDALLFGDATDDHLPWTIMPDVDPNEPDDICFKREGFGGLTAEVTLEAETIEEYLANAVDFANNTLWGSLCAILIVHPKSLRQPKVAEAIERAIAELRYGTVSVNMLAFYSSYFMVCPWGAIPGHDIYDVQSGMGKNFNFRMFDQVEKVVVRAPFRRIDPLTIRSKRAFVFAEKLTTFEASPSWLKLADLMLSAITS